MGVLSDSDKIFANQAQVVKIIEPQFPKSCWYFYRDFILIVVGMVDIVSLLQMNSTGVSEKNQIKRIY